MVLEWASAVQEQHAVDAVHDAHVHVLVGAICVVLVVLVHDLVHHLGRYSSLKSLAENTDSSKGEQVELLDKGEAPKSISPGRTSGRSTPAMVRRTKRSEASDLSRSSCRFDTSKARLFETTSLSGSLQSAQDLCCGVPKGHDTGPPAVRQEGGAGQFWEGTNASVPWHAHGADAASMKRKS